MNIFVWNRYHTKNNRKLYQCAHRIVAKISVPIPVDTQLTEENIFIFIISFKCIIFKIKRTSDNYDVINVSVNTKIISIFQPIQMSNSLSILWIINDKRLIEYFFSYLVEPSGTESSLDNRTTTLLFYLPTL